MSAYSVGNLVNRESGTLAKVVSTDPMRVEFVVSEMDILTMRDYRRTEKGRPDVRVRLFLQNGAAYPLDGKIDFWNNEINPNTGTLKLQAVFQNPERLLLPGMFVRIRLGHGSRAFSAGGVFSADGAALRMREARKGSEIHSEAIE